MKKTAYSIWAQSYPIVKACNMRKHTPPPPFFVCYLVLDRFFRCLYISLVNTANIFLPMFNSYFPFAFYFVKVLLLFFLNTGKMVCNVVAVGNQNVSLIFRPVYWNVFGLVLMVPCSVTPCHQYSLLFQQFYVRVVKLIFI